MHAYYPFLLNANVFDNADPYPAYYNSMINFFLSVIKDNNTAFLSVSDYKMFEHGW